MSNVQQRISDALAAIGDDPPEALKPIREALFEARLHALSGKPMAPTVVSFEPYEAMEIARFRADVLDNRSLSEIIRGLVMDNALMLERRDQNYVNPLFRTQPSILTNQDNG